MELIIKDPGAEDIRDAFGISKHRQAELSIIGKRLFFEAVKDGDKKYAQVIPQMAEQSRDLAEFICIKNAHDITGELIEENKLFGLALTVGDGIDTVLEELDRDWVELQNT